MFRSIVLVATMSIAVLTAAPALSATKLVIAGSEASGSLLDRMSVKFTEILKEKDVDGEFKPQLIRGQSLGSAQQVLEQHQAGLVDVMYNRLDWYTSMVPDFQVLTWGFTFADKAHMKKFFDSEIFEDLRKQAIDKMGVRVLGATADQPRILYSTKPVTSVDDVKGMKIRVPGIKAYLELWGTLEAVPTQIAWAEAFLALNTGVVDAAEADASGAYSQKFHVAAPNVTLTNHLISSANISVNEDRWNSLSEKQQKVLSEAAQEALDWMTEEADKDAGSILAKMKKEGATISEIDNAPFAEKARSGAEKMEADGLWSKGLWQRIQDIKN